MRVLQKLVCVVKVRVLQSSWSRFKGKGSNNSIKKDFQKNNEYKKIYDFFSSTCFQTAKIRNFFIARFWIAFYKNLFDELTKFKKFLTQKGSKIIIKQRKIFLSYCLGPARPLSKLVTWHLKACFWKNFNSKSKIKNCILMFSIT